MVRVEYPLMASNETITRGRANEIHDREQLPLQCAPPRHWPGERFALAPEDAKATRGVALTYSPGIPHGRGIRKNFERSVRIIPCRFEIRPAEAGVLGYRLF